MKQLWCVGACVKNKLKAKWGGKKYNVINVFKALQATEQEQKMF